MISSRTMNRPVSEPKTTHFVMGTPVLHLDSATVTYKGVFQRKNTGHTPIYNLSMTLRAGETLGVVGKNGAGKSTLLRLLAGLIEPDAGTIHIAKGITRSLLALGVGFVPELTGSQNARLGLQYLGVARKDIKRLVKDIKEFSELGRFFERPVTTYSSGMRTRLSFSVAQYAEPDILLIDEVLSVGDKAFKEKASNSIKSMIKSDTTVVLVSHSEKAISALCDRVLWIEQGRVKAIGATEQIMSLYSPDQKEQDDTADTDS